MFRSVQRLINRLTNLLAFALNLVAIASSILKLLYGLLEIGDLLLQLLQPFDHLLLNAIVQFFELFHPFDIFQILVHLPHFFLQFFDLLPELRLDFYELFDAVVQYLHGVLVFGKFALVQISIVALQILHLFLQSWQVYFFHLLQFLELRIKLLDIVRVVLQINECLLKPYRLLLQILLFTVFKLAQPLQ